MLRFLRIEHVAVIDALEVEFEPGLNVLTGETGAGKSMLVGAVGLLIGGRASADLIRTGESAAKVQAVFDVPSVGRPKGRHYRDGDHHDGDHHDGDHHDGDHHDGDHHDSGSADLQVGHSELIVRREITSQGRSRAFVNDTLVTAAALKDQTSPLVELHGQHEHQTLLDPESHLALLDEFAGLDIVRATVGETFHEWKRVQAEADAFQMDERERAARVDLLKFQVGELEKANLRAGEDEELETSKRVLANADKLQRLCNEAYSALYDDDQAALSQLAAVWKRVGELAEVDPAFQPHVSARDAIKSHLEELAFALRSYAQSIDASPARLQEVEDRLALLQRLKRKYGTTLDGVIAAKASLARQLDALQHSDERRAGLESAARAARDEFLKRAHTLSASRRSAARDFARKIELLLGELGMGPTQFEIRFNADTPEAAWTERGIDVAECYLSANVGEDLRPLARIASGGELSRVMLAIRTLAAADTPGKTLIFDEIDSGIGGRTAYLVGHTLRRLGGSFQVLCITHRPPIAAAGHAHFHISKAVTRGRTQTRVVRLNDHERVEELARMIGGAVPTDATRATARELLAAGDEGKTKGESETRSVAKAKTANSRRH